MDAAYMNLSDELVKGVWKNVNSLAQLASVPFQVNALKQDRKRLVNPEEWSL
jgi:hypothetical protein